MALQTDTVSLTLATSLTQESDNKQIDTTKLAASANTRVVKTKEVVKRPGLQDYPTTQTSLTGTNPILIGTSQTKNIVEEFATQKIMRNKGVFYAHNDGTNVWEQRAYTPVLKVTEQPVASSAYTATYQDTSTAFGYTATVTSDDTFVRYSIFRISDGVYLAKDVIIYTSNSVNVNVKAVRVVAMASTFAVVFSQTAIYGAIITPSTGACSVPASLAASSVDDVDAIYLPSATPGATLVVLGVRSGTNTLYTFTTALASRAITIAFASDVSATVNYLYNNPANVNRVHGYQIVGSGGALSGGVNYAYDLGASSWTLVRAVTKIQTDQPVASLPAMNGVSATALVDAQDATKINVFYSFSNTVDGFGYVRSYPEYVTYVVTTDLSGVVTTASAVWSYGACVVAEPYNDTERLTTLVPVAYYSKSSPFAGIADFHRPRVSRRMYLTAKMATGKVTASLAQMKNVTNGRQRATRTWITSDGFAFSYLAIQRFISIDKNEADVGADVSYVSLTNDNRAAFVNNRTYFIGGAQSWAYDGADVGEHGFSFTPDPPVLSLGAGVQNLIVVTPGSGTAAHVFSLQLENALAFQALIPGNPINYFKFSDTVNTFVVWYTVDGNGSSPVGLYPGAISVPVTLLSTDSYAEVLYKTRFALQNVTPSPAYSYAINYTTRTITFMGNIVGAPTAAAAIFGNDVGDENNRLPLGTYQVCTVFSYIDRNGSKYRSAPSAVTSFTTTAQTVNFSVVIPVTDITNREYKLNNAEVYMTEANGSVFYWLGSNSPTSRVIWNGGKRLTFSNVNAASGILQPFTVPFSSNEQLYTTGDVLENDYTTGWDKFTTYKGRAVIGFPSSQALTYSKTAARDEGLAFSDFLQVVVDQDDDYIGAIGELDDKLIVFKEKRKYAVVGEPANDAGSGSSLSTPTLISSDTGCDQQQSLVQSSAGLFYRSQKGVYLLGRDLSDKYIGKMIQDSNPFTISRAVQMPNVNEIGYFFSDSDVAYIFNYEDGIWSQWPNHQCDYVSSGSTLFLVRLNGRVLREIIGTTKDVENGVTTAVTYLIEMPWLKLKGQQDYQRIYDAMILGAYKSPHSLQVEFWWDYDMRDVVKQTLVIPSTDIISGTGYADQTYQAKFSPMIQKCEAIKLRISDIPVDVNNAESCTLNAVDFTVGMKKGQNKFKAEKKV